MATASDYYTGVPADSRGDWAGPSEFTPRGHGILSHPAGIAITGLAVGALLLAAAMYVAPDVKRYLKMRSM